jgi:hypothetical protein
MKYIVTESYHVDVPEEGSDKWQQICYAWRINDPATWEGWGKEVPFRPTSEDMAKYMTTMSHTGCYDGDVELHCAIASSVDVGGSWHDPENGVQHAEQG